MHHAFALRSGLAPDADLTVHDLGCGNCQGQQIGVHRYDNQIPLLYAARGAAPERSTPAMGLTMTGKGSIAHAPGRCLVPFAKSSGTGTNDAFESYGLLLLHPDDFANGTRHLPGAC